MHVDLKLNSRKIFDVHFNILFLILFKFNFNFMFNLYCNVIMLKKEFSFSYINKEIYTQLIRTSYWVIFYSVTISLKNS